MNFGADIEDLYEQPEQKNLEKTPTRTTKICSPKWFLEASVTSTDKEEVLKCLRYKADYLYSTKEYTEACKTYERCLELLPVTNIPATRECMEGLSRSLLQDGNPEKALEWALKMHAAAESCDQKVSSWNLLATVCHTLGKYEEELEALHCCLEVHMTNPDFWLRLAFCYSGLFKISLPNSGCAPVPPHFCCNFRARTFIPSSAASSGVSVPATEHCDFLNTNLEETVQNHIEDTATDMMDHSIDRRIEKCEMCSLATQVVSACLIRTRILNSNCNNQSAIGQRKSNKLNEKVNACLAHMEVDQLFIDEASEMLRSEMYENASKKRDVLAQQNHSTETCAQDNAELLLSQDLQSLKF